MMKKLLLLLFVIFMYGCGGGDNDNSSPPDPIVDDIKAPLAQLRVSQVNLLDEEDRKISLSKSVSDPQELPISLVSVKALTDGCSDPVFDKKTLTFEIEKSDLNYCAYQYTVKNNSSNTEYDKTSSNISYVVMSETGRNSILEPLSESTTVGELISINLKDKLGDIFSDNFTLQDDVYILGSGSVSVDSVNSIINYNSDTAGVTRLMYSIHDSDTNETMIGYVDVAVSEKGNTMPEADDFPGPENVALNSEIEIDVAPHIRDLDGDSLQLTDVYVYNDEADVDVVSKIDFTNTKFTFSASKAGVYDVTYIVYDHRNGFAVGIVKIKVEGPALPWHDITLLEDGEYYTAPLDKNIADLYHIYYQSLGDYTLDGIDYKIPKFNYKSAETLCISRGMILPTKDQLIKLSNSLEVDVINELGKWPTIDKFWTLDQASTAGKHFSFNFDDNSFSEDDDIFPYIVTCVAPGKLNVEVTRNDSCTTTSIDSPVCYDEITATVLHRNEPMENESIYIYSNDKSLFMNKTQGYTDAQGQVVFQIRSQEAGEHPVYVSYYSQRVEELLNFILDTIVKFEVTPSSATINVGSSLDLSSRITKSSDIEEIVTEDTTFQILDGSDVVSLTDNTVKGLSKGNAIIIGTYIDDVEGKSFNALSTITVLDPYEIVSTTLEPEVSGIDIGEEYDLIFMATLYNGDSKRLTDEAVWTVDDKNIASVDSSGHVVGLANGITTFTVYPKDKPNDPNLVKTATVYVNDFIDWVEITPKKKTIDINGTVQMTLKAHFKSGDVQILDANDVTWESSSSNIATINKNGLVTGLAPGTTKVSGSINGLKATADITVNDVVTSVELTPAKKTINIGATVQLKLKAHYKSGNIETVAANQVTWSKNNNNVTVNAGTVTGVKAGSSTVTGSYKGKAATSNITVNDFITSVQLTPAQSIIYVGENVQLTLQANYKSGKTETIAANQVTWSKNNNNITLNAGSVTGVKAGSSTVTGSYKNKTATANITINRLPEAHANGELNFYEGQCTFVMGTKHDFGINTNYSVESCNGSKVYTPIYGKSAGGLEYVSSLQYQITKTTGALESMLVYGKGGYMASIVYCRTTGDGTFSDSDGKSYSVTCTSFYSGNGMTIKPIK
ncbi:TPA: Ig-like domain-containing protein [Photobacterium damselae]